METFSALLAICAGNSHVTGEFPAQRPVTRSFDVLFDLRLDGRLIKQSRGRWFETSSRPLWRHSNVLMCEVINTGNAKCKAEISCSTNFCFPRIFHLTALPVTALYITMTKLNLSDDEYMAIAGNIFNVVLWLERGSPRWKPFAACQESEVRDMLPMRFTAPGS